MTRKRFEKKMMAAGVPRNAARVMASRRPARATYDQWFSCCFIGVAFRSFGAECRCVADMLRILLRAARLACGEVLPDE